MAFNFFFSSKFQLWFQIPETSGHLPSGSKNKHLIQENLQVASLWEKCGGLISRETPHTFWLGQKYQAANFSLILVKCTEAFGGRGMSDEMAPKSNPKFFIFRNASLQVIRQIKGPYLTGKWDGTKHRPSRWLVILANT